MTVPYFHNFCKLQVLPMQTTEGKGQIVLVPVESIPSQQVFEYRLAITGFAKLREFLESAKVDCTLSLGDLGMKEGWSFHRTNVAFCYENNPSLGWRKEISVTMSGKNLGANDTYYTPPDRRRRFKTRPELNAYLLKNNISLSVGNKCDFRNVFCVCHTPEDNSRPYIECSFGKGGCNGWIHPECVGLGSRTEEEIEEMSHFICPFCTVYLEGSGEISLYPDIVKLREISPHMPKNMTKVNEFLIHESNKPHSVWGIPETTYCYQSSPPPSPAILMKKDDDLLQFSEVDSVNCDFVNIKPVILKSRLNINDTTNNGTSNSNNNINTNVGNAAKYSVAAKTHDAVTESWINFVKNKKQEQHESSSTVATVSNLTNNNTGSPTIHSHTHSSNNINKPMSYQSKKQLLSSKKTVDTVSSSESASSLRQLGGIFQHRLLQNLLPLSFINNGDINNNNSINNNNNNSINNNTSVSSYNNNEKKRIVDIIGTPDTTVTADNNSDIEMIKDNITNKDVHSDSKLKMAINNKNKNSNDNNNNALEQDESLLNEHDIQFDNMNDDDENNNNTASLLNKSRRAYIKDSNKVIDVKIEWGGLNSLAKKSVPCSLEASTEVNNTETEQIKQNVLLKHQQNQHITKIPLGVKYKRDVMEAGISMAHSARTANALTNNKKPKSSNNDFKDSYTPKPVMAYLPLEDGGLRYSSISCVFLPKSYHILCSLGLQCGYCMTVIPDSNSSNSGNNGSNNNKNNNKNNSNDLLQKLTPVHFGKIQYSIHKQCEYALTHPLTSFNDRSNFVNVLHTHEYYKADEVTCDLCGRQGGVMQYFHINPMVSALSSKLWIAHVPCLHYLIDSPLLMPLEDSLVHDEAFHKYFNITLQKEDKLTRNSLIANSTIVENNDKGAEKGSGIKESNNSVSIANDDDVRTEISSILEEMKYAISCSTNSNASQKYDSNKPKRQHERKSNPEAKSRFDIVYNHWRCGLCGIHAGLVMRCIAAGCTVRSHLLCVSLGGKEWKLLDRKSVV